MKQYIPEMMEHFKQEYPREGCGVLAVRKGKLHWFPCSNVAKDDDDFEINPREYYAIKRSADIVAVVHSHPDCACDPSEADVRNCNALGVPYYIVSYPEGCGVMLYPDNNPKPLYGREYEFGKSDCFEAARDWYSREYMLDLPEREDYQDDWWKKDLDYFNKEYIESWGFKEVSFDDMEVGSLLIFSIAAGGINNHCGVYLGHEMFYHHAVNRLSCREPLDYMWRRGLTGVYNYDA